MPNCWKFLHDPDVYRDPFTFNPDRYLSPVTNSIRLHGDFVFEQTLLLHMMVAA